MIPDNMKIIIKQKVVLTILLLMTGSFLLYSQSADFLDGKVVNTATANPVPFATIKLKNNQLGVYANADGDFKISRNVDFNNDSLLITCIGYKESSVAFKDLRETGVNKIFLTPVVYGLNEVKVIASRRKISPLIILRRAIRNITNNYPDKPFNYIAYYRDYQKKDSDYINLNEAIIQTLDGGFATESIYGTYKLLDFRKNTEFPRMDISPYYGFIESDEINYPDKIIPKAKLGDQYGNELFILLVHDALRNYNKRSFSFVETLSNDFIFNHIFENPVTVLNNNTLLYKISFKGRPSITGDSLAVSGAIYIQPQDYSIHKLEYSSFYRRKNALKPFYNIDIEYGHENSADSRMCLKYISFNNIFKVRGSKDDDYFRVISSGWDTLHVAKTTVIVNFNHNIDLRTASNKNNFEITFGKRKIKIISIQVVGKKLYIRLKDEDLEKKTNTLSVSIKNIKDTNGDILDKRKSQELFQYRELFVQDYNKTLPYTDTCSIEYKPLELNCISKYSGNFNYWMNTPSSIKSIK